MGKGAIAAKKAASAAEKKAELEKKLAAEKAPIPHANPNPSNKTIILDGVLASKSMARSQEEWNFVKEIQHGGGRTSEIRNIKVGDGVDGKPAPSITCWHATKPSANFTVFFRWVEKPGKSPGVMRVIGYGNHTRSNTEYRVLWSNGSTTNLNLNDLSKAGAEYIPAVDA